MSLFDDILKTAGRKPSESKADPDLKLAFDFWTTKQPFYGKLPKDDDTVIKIKAGDFRKLSAAAYAAGFQRSKL